MSLKLIDTEIRRFLLSTEPEVLCVKGRWGVGKTFGWKKFLAEAKEAGAVGLQRYSYVSLFGLNNLDDLRFSIFESGTSGALIGSNPDEATFGELVGKGSNFARRMRPAVDVVSAVFNRKGVTDLLYKSAFLTVRNQIVCLDDLERAGAGLSARDVLGLASFLKEERRCKVVLLLNDKEHDEKDEFERQLEKVADVTLVFDLTPEEAAEIAVTGTDRASMLVRPLVISLSITNIRVIKKIERLAGRLVGLLGDLDARFVEKAVATLVLASWSVQQPGEAPPLDFLRGYNSIAIMARAGRDEPDAATARWRKSIEGYPFQGPEYLDQMVMDGAASGFFRDAEIRRAAEGLQDEWRRRSRETAFSRAWTDLYHGSLATDDDDFLHALFESAMDEAVAISPLNINSAILMLREAGWGEQANVLIAHYIDANAVHGPRYFDIGRHHFSHDAPLDQGLCEAFASKLAECVDDRDPVAVLKSIGEQRGWNDEDVAFLAKLDAGAFERAFETLQGEALRPAIEMILAIGNGGTEQASAVRDASLRALKSIAAKSPLRARKLARFGIELDPKPGIVAD